ncbi:thymidine phosphorylase [Kordiimonas sp. SCSIO 12610]|uniref:thymidine phosphorylase n=1 Tax=Kordiimonas sp. SCSIO 12610 TaxID=2829597 RepID=UPI0021FACB5A|nr:thymidine phosphorylase [Kordiimonas sp. SCSIO 12610]
MDNKGSFLPQEIIRQKRDGATLTDAQIADFVAGITDASVTDAQISALAMAVFFNGMTPEEGAALTLSMRDSGTVINWGDYGFDKDAPIVDKHSTGGVGDKVSLMLAPIVAAIGGYVPMISGRGLGHTGGTLDKLESIPGYDAFPDVEVFAGITKEIGCSIIGQTANLAPADKRFYGVRDVTATVESVPLITASILSKKLAAGLNALVMDVKFGNGAFMDSAPKAQILAENIVRVANAAGVPTTALLTDMNQVLGRTAGNAVELIETVEFLRNPGSADQRLVDVTLGLAAHMASLGKIYSTPSEARSHAKAALENGRALEIFAKMVAAQKGPIDFIENPTKYLDIAPVERAVYVKDTGFVSAMDTRAIGVAVVALGGGRVNPGHAIDHSVGITEIAQIGDRVDRDKPIAMVYAKNEADADIAEETLKGAFVVSEGQPNMSPVVTNVIEG